MTTRVITAHTSSQGAHDDTLVLTAQPGKPYFVDTNDVSLILNRSVISLTKPSTAGGKKLLMVPRSRGEMAPK